jgi:formate hydrogenlyase subunit 3/multisubunit Na+/H+ antiporter MnhD subunit
MAMWLKIVIMVLILAMLLSLSRAMVYLFKDTGNESRRLMYALIVRVSLAVLLLVCLVYGFSTGILSYSAPWVGKY